MLLIYFLLVSESLDNLYVLLNKKTRHKLFPSLVYVKIMKQPFWHNSALVALRFNETVLSVLFYFPKKKKFLFIFLTLSSELFCL